MERIIGVNPVIEVLQNKEKNIEKLEMFKGNKDEKLNKIKKIALTFIQTPPAGAILAAKELPSTGGDTLWEGRQERLPSSDFLKPANNQYCVRCDHCSADPGHSWNIQINHFY